MGVLVGGRPPGVAIPPAAGRSPDGAAGPEPYLVTVLVAVAVLAVGLPVVATLDLPLPGRSGLALLFMVCVPGVPAALLLRLPDPLLTAALAISISLSYAVLNGTWAMAGGWWHPVASSWISAGLGLVCVVAAAIRSRRSSRRAGSQPRARPARGAHGARWSRPLSVVVLGASGSVWWLETRRLPLDQVGVLGLLPTLSWRYLLALALLCAVVGYHLVRPRVDHLVLTLGAVLVALIGYATVAVADGEGNVGVSWVHVGFVQYINQHGSVPLSVDARFSWPGFFAASAQLVTLAGARDARHFLLLAPVAYLLLALPALLVVARSVTRSWRWAWVAVFILLLTNWYQQDYFSPQATAFVLYVTILATLLWMTEGAQIPPLPGGLLRRCRHALGRLPGLPPGVDARTAQAIGLVLAVLVLGLVAGHQLTPVTLVFSLVAFTVTGLTRYRMLWVLTAVAIGGWFSYGATDFWFGHLDNVIGDIGKVGSSLGSSVSGRLVGDPTYQASQYVRIGWSALLFGAAALGAWALRRRPDALLLTALALAPFGLVVVQSYGGEVFIRCFLYASPVLAPLAAVALQRVARAISRAADRRRGPATGRRPRSLGWLLAVVPLICAAALVLTFTRGLNASFERSPRQQVVASDLLYEQARPGDTVGLPLGAGLTPYLKITDVAVEQLPVLDCEQTAVRLCLGPTPPRFVLVTITQERYGELVQSRPQGWAWRLADGLVASGEYEAIYSAADARLLRQIQRPGP